MDKITVVIYTRNEEHNIAECLTSALFLTKSIIIVDMESTDRTVEIAKKMKTKVVSFPYSHYVEPAREFGIKKAETDWVFILDADERITIGLSTEIRSAIGSSRYTHYKIPRKNIFSKIKWLSHGGWWPDHQIRLIKRDAFNRWPKRIHSTPQIKGELGYLKNPIIHYFHGKLSGMVNKTMVFEDIESDLLFKAGRSAGTATFFRKYFAELSRRLILKMAFLDGSFGIIEAIYQAYSKTITYLFLYEKQKGRAV